VKDHIKEEKEMIPKEEMQVITTIQLTTVIQITEISKKMEAAVNTMSIKPQQMESK
jgi:hypothetical protein